MMPKLYGTTGIARLLTASILFLPRSSVLRINLTLLLMHQNGRFWGKDELICQYPHPIKLLLMSAEPSLRNMYGNMSKKY